ncbi:hypothetical protein KIW84_060971 [Lathyrus oleraceus]|uniref:Uncharacterized protein n=1 Tax=Pisum sativum TaxID=3888 RepID=A0A9D5A3P9_PEA|nr:hypothetical protein KIW84_060971 [Pisum sativum]
MLKDDIKYGNEDVIQVVPNNSEYVTDAKPNVQDIVVTTRRKIRGKRILVDVSFAHRDKVTFHPETSGQKLKYVLQRRIETERNIGEQDLD